MEQKIQLYEEDVFSIHVSNIRTVEKSQKLATKISPVLTEICGFHPLSASFSSTDKKRFF